MLDIIARGGGGGSGGDSSGGGIFVLFGFLPMQIIGSRLRKKSSIKPNKKIFLQIVGWSIAIVYCLFWLIILKSFLGTGIGIASLIGMASGLYGWFGKLKQSKKVKADLELARSTDSSWDETAIIDYASKVFMKFQQDWSNLNAVAMKSYQTPYYQSHNALMVYALQLAGRRNEISDIAILNSMITDVHDAKQNNNDIVVVGFEASVKDEIIDITSNKVMFKSEAPFTEFWRFKRSGNGWLLDGIQQATQSEWRRNVELEDFASSKGFYFSLDWGWLLLPKRGQLFDKGKFGTSDINNHVIGLYNKQLLIQIYTYIPVPVERYNSNRVAEFNVNIGKNTGKSYLIAQTYVPRSYGNIVVRHKQRFSLFNRIKGLKKVTTEWADFNKKYEVFATSQEQATSLELLNPKYMEKLEAVPFKVNIEVVDNIIYLYSNEKNTKSATAYESMLSLLQSAFKEMKL